MTEADILRKALLNLIKAIPDDLDDGDSVTYDDVEPMYAAVKQARIALKRADTAENKEVE